MKKSRKKYYEILCKKRQYRYGVFPFSEEGKKDAKKYIKELLKAYKEEFFIREK